MHLQRCPRKHALVSREEGVKEFESKLIQQLYETFAAIRLVKSFSREPHELRQGELGAVVELAVEVRVVQDGEAHGRLAGRGRG